MKRSKFLGRRLWPLFIIAAACSGCAITDEGATDFRQVPVGRETSPPQLEDVDEAGKKRAISLRKDFLPSETSNPINPGEPLAITLKHVFIKDFTEVFGNPFIKTGGPNGEIAIVANVFEDDGTRTIDYGPSGLDNARVVYFSDDVWKGQFLNFHDIPLYGPLTYRGHALVLDLYIVELDQSGEQLRQLVSNLAQIGKTFYPPASPVAGPLAQLAGTLIGDQQDDRALRFTLYQRPPGGIKGIRYSVLDAGYLLFVREQNRRVETAWTHITLNPRLAKLMYTDSRSTETGEKINCNRHVDKVEVPGVCLYRESTYMVVEVNTAPSALKQDRQQMLYSALQAALAGQNPPIFSQDPQALQEALAALADNMAQSERASAASAALAKVENESRNQAERLAAAENFAAIWFEKTEQGQAVAFPAEEASRLLERVSLQLAKCGVSASELSNLMESVRSKDPGAQNSVKNQLIANLACRGS